MNWLLVAGSLGGVLALTGVAWALGLGGAALTDEAEAMRIAEAELPGFVGISAELGDDRQSAVVTGVDGDCVRLRRHGAQFVAEPVQRG
jgi:hypothetical protein